MLSLTTAIAVFLVAVALYFGVPAFKTMQQEKRYAAWLQTVESMKRAAGLKPGMPRRQRRELGRRYAKMLAVVERHRQYPDGTTVRPRSNIRRRQRIVAQLLGRALTPVR